MSIPIEKRQFLPLEPDGSNFVKWKQNVENHLRAKKLSKVITAEFKAKEDDEEQQGKQAEALIFLQHHLTDELQNGYADEKVPVRALATSA